MIVDTLRRIGFSTLWLGFALYAFTSAPSSQPDTLDLIIRLSTGDWNGINPLIVSLFNLMGVWPAIYACLLLIDGTQQKLAAWPFVAAAFGVGAFAVLPYQALRDRTQNPPAPYDAKADVERSKLLSVLDSPWTGRVLLLSAIALLSYGLFNGSFTANWQDFLGQWETSKFIHVMSLDFCMLCIILAPLLRDDMIRHGLKDNTLLFWIATLIPLFGVLIYLSVRPPLTQTITQQAT